MNIDIAGRHLSVTAAMQEYVHEKVQRMVAHFNGVQSAHVTLSIEGGRHVVELVLGALRGQLVAKASDDLDMYAAIDAAVDKVSRQVDRVKERLQGRRRRQKPGEILANELEASDEEDDDFDFEDMDFGDVDEGAEEDAAPEEEI